MDLRRPRQEKLDALYEMIEGGTEMKHAKRLSGRAAAILVCAALAITAAAAAAVPAVWEKLWEQLGAFAPYAQTIDGAVCRDQGIDGAHGKKAVVKQQLGESPAGLGCHLLGRGSEVAA